MDVVTTDRACIHPSASFQMPQIANKAPLNIVIQIKYRLCFVARLQSPCIDCCFSADRDAATRESIHNLDDTPHLDDQSPRFHQEHGQARYREGTDLERMKDVFLKVPVYMRTIKVPPPSWR